jgi:hypothetical protein
MKRYGWIPLALTLIACNLLAKPGLTPSPEALAPTQELALTPAPSSQPSAAPPTLASDQQVFNEDGVELHYPTTWVRQPEAETSPDPAWPDTTLVIASASDDVQMSFHCMPITTFASRFGGIPDTPSDAGEVLWDLMLGYFVSSGQHDQLLVGMLEEFNIGDWPAIQVRFTSPGLSEPLGVENPMELAQPETTYYKLLTIVMETDALCYIVTTARSEEARAEPEVSAILESIRFR